MMISVFDHLCSAFKLLLMKPNTHFTGFTIRVFQGRAGRIPDEQLEAF